jgi:hypothetical protein
MLRAESPAGNAMFATSWLKDCWDRLQETMGRGMSWMQSEHEERSKEVSFSFRFAVLFDCYRVAIIALRVFVFVFVFDKFLG